jgi:hypothetical protein
MANKPVILALEIDTIALITFGKAVDDRGEVKIDDSNIGLLMHSFGIAKKLIRYVIKDIRVDPDKWILHWNKKAHENGFKLAILIDIVLPDTKRCAMFASKLIEAMESCCGPNFASVCSPHAEFVIMNGVAGIYGFDHYQRCTPPITWPTDGSGSVIADGDGDDDPLVATLWDCKGLVADYVCTPKHDEIIRFAVSAGLLSDYTIEYAADNVEFSGNSLLYVRARPSFCPTHGHAEAAVLVKLHGGHVYVYCVAAEGASPHVTGCEHAMCRSAYAGRLNDGAAIESYDPTRITRYVAEDLIVEKHPELAESLGLTINGAPVPGACYRDALGVERLPPVPYETLEELTRIHGGAGQRRPLVAHAPTASGKTTTLTTVMCSTVQQGGRVACASAFVLLVLATKDALQKAIAKEPALAHLKVAHYKDDNISPDERILCVCTNSLSKIEDSDSSRNEKLALVIDEINSTIGMCGAVIDYATFCVIEENIASAISRNNSLVMLSDAFFDDVSLAFLKAIGSPPPAILTTRALPYRNWKVELVATTREIGKECLREYPNTWIADAYNLLMAGENVLLACSSKKNVDMALAFFNSRLNSEEGRLPPGTTVKGIHSDMTEKVREENVTFFTSDYMGTGPIVFAFTACMGTGVSSPPGLYKHVVRAP